MKPKCIVMLSGGLDSRLALKIMQEQLGNDNVLAVHFNLPFGTGCCDKNCSFNFAQLNGAKLKVIDCSQGEMLQKYLKIIREAKHGRGAGINPCIDCRSFIFRLAKDFIEEEGYDFIVTGEVLDERPMSQHKKAMETIDRESDLQGKILRPLSAKLLPETDAEKKGVVDRSKLYGIRGRRRLEQMELAKGFDIDYPTPGGGCLLCEKELKERLKYLVLKRGLDDHEINLVNVGRHFHIDGSWIVLGRNKEENQILEGVAKHKGELIVPDFPGPSALILDEGIERNKVEDLIKVYSIKGNLEERKELVELKL